jgi:predicted NBD/HSP70 family sugar kinase
MNQPRQPGIDMVILNRFGLAATIVWNGQLYTGASHYAGDLGLLPTAGSQSRLYRDVCTGAALLRLARLREDRRPFQELIQSPDCPAFTEWLRGAVPAFAQAIYAAVIAYNPDRVLIEGIFNRFPAGVRRRIVELVTAELEKTANMLPEIRFFEGDDLMGARGAALLARDDVVDEAMIRIIRSSQEQ